MDVFMAFPLIIMALAIVATLGNGIENVIIAITIPFIPQCARVVRSSALAIREIPYVDAARALGFTHSRIILRHMAPNVMAPFLIGEHARKVSINELLTMHLGPDDVLVNMSLDFADGLSSADVEALVNELEKKIKASHEQVTRVFIEAQSFAAHSRQ